jgi:hypothetical protein
MPAPMQEFADWDATGEDWRPANWMPSYRELLRALGDEKVRVAQLRTMLNDRVQAIADAVQVDPLYLIELEERGLR